MTGQQRDGNGNERDNVKGGAWLIAETDPSAVMTPERITEEHG